MFLGDFKGERMWELLNVTLDRHSLGAACLIVEPWTLTCQSLTPHWTWTPRQPRQSFSASFPLLLDRALSPWICQGGHIASLTYIIDVMKTINVVLWDYFFSLSKVEKLYLLPVNVYINTFPGCFMDVFYLGYRKRETTLPQNLNLN